MSFGTGGSLTAVPAKVLTGGDTILSTASTSYGNVVIVLLTLAALSLGVWLFKRVFFKTVHPLRG